MLRALQAGLRGLAMGVMVILLCGFGRAAVQDAPPANPPTPAVSAANDEQIRQLVERGYVAVDQLIPGDFAAESPLIAPLRGAVESLVRGDSARAREELAAVAEQQSGWPPAGLLLAGVQFAIGKNDAGRLELEKTATEHPEYPGIYTAFARLALNEGRWTDTLALVDRLHAATVASTWSEDQARQFRMEYLDAIADAHAGRSQFAEARPYLAELLALLPENPNVRIRLADLDYRERNFDAALTQLTAAREKNTALVPPELLLYQWASRDGEYEIARQWMEAAAARHAEDLSVQLEYGKYLLENDEPTEAAVWVDKAEKGGAAATATRFVRGQISYYRGAFQVAEADFQALSTQFPNDAPTKNMLALCLIESEEAIKRQQALEMANYNLQVNPNNAYFASTLAWVLYRMGNAPQANQLLARISSLPNIPTDAVYYISRLLAESGENQRAAELLRESLTAKGLYLQRQRAAELLKEVETRLAAPDSGGGSI